MMVGMVGHVTCHQEVWTEFHITQDYGTTLSINPGVIKHCTSCIQCTSTKYDQITYRGLELVIAILGSRIQDPEIPAVFPNPESRDWQHPNPGTLVLQKLVKIVLFAHIK